jgi:folate-dependent phosphoribosylglycinamide formyltransferase PurN
MYRIGWFSTGRDSAAGELLTAVQDSIGLGEIKAEFSFVFSNREPGETEESDQFFEMVRGYHIPLICFSSQKYKAQKKGEPISQWRLEYDREVIQRLAGFHPDLDVLAGYMLIVGTEMCQKYNMINLHPAAPGGPAGTWQEVIWKLIENSAAQTGVMMHLVTSELDKGPPVTYCTFPIRGERFNKYWGNMKNYSLEQIKSQQGENNPLFKLIRQHGLMREFPLIVATIKAFSEGRVRIGQKEVVDASGKPIRGYDLTHEIDGILKKEHIL